MQIIKTIPLLLVALIVAQPAHALFEDKKARERVIEVEKKVVNNQQSVNAELATLRQQLEALESVVKGQGLADLLNQIERLNRENAQLKGELEVLMHQLSQMEQREKDLYVDTDARIRTIEESLSAQQTAAQAAAEEAAAETDQDKQLNQGYLLLEESAYQMAFEVFDQLIKDNPEYPRLDEAKYGLAYSQYSLKNYKSTIATVDKFVKAHPESTKIPEAMMIKGNAQIQLGRVKSAKRTFKQLLQSYPDSTVAPTAKKRLKVLAAF